MRRSEHHGIPVLTMDGAAPLFGALMIRAGALDETARTTQISHVLEHLAHTRLPRTHLDHNATVTPSTTVFHATGRPGAVADHLNAIAEALRDLPLEHLARELDVVDVEAGVSAHPAIGLSAGVRFGSQGPGLIGGGPAPVTTLTEQHLREYASRHVSRDNAVLVFSGEVPGNLDVRLPAGTRNVRVVPEPLQLELPGVVGSPAPFPILSYVLPRDDRAWLLGAILEDRVTQELRHRRGMSYSVEGDVLHLGDRVLVAHMPDGREGQERALAEQLWASLRELADHGPSEEELEHAVGAFAEAVHDPRAVPDHLLTAASALLVGETPQAPEDVLDDLRGVTPDQVRRWAGVAVEGSLMLMPTEGPEATPESLPGLPVVPDPPSDSPVEGRAFRRRAVALLAPSDLRAVVGPDGISLTARAYTWAAAWEDVVAVARTSRDREVHLRDGRSFHLCDRHLKDTAALFDVLDERTADVSFQVPEDSLH
ncbi:M16 family metallopeptidase [Ornithinimicrobium cerasi]|uniref:M16 family metallopeptidase n=1 Tax=Ornithinimicrobium cerasi TaxID=2248773 RepID=UPI000EFEA04F|nr:insulinase family protein [Ornithinimicrobium cerasi]